MKILINYNGNVPHTFSSAEHELIIINQQPEDVPFADSVFWCEGEDLSMLSRLVSSSYLQWKTANILQESSLRGIHYDLAVNTHRPTLQGVKRLQPHEYAGVLTSDYRVAYDSQEFMVHPSTFIRLANFWKFKPHFDLSVYDMSGVQLGIKATENHIWAGWVCLNRLHFVQL